MKGDNNMKKVMFISFPVVGHVNASINICKELAANNIQVIYYTLEEHVFKFEGIKNIEVRKYPETFAKYCRESKQAPAKIKKNLVALLHIIYLWADMLVPFLQEEVKREKPDLIIADSLSMYGKMVARMNNIPLVLLFTHFVGRPGKSKLPPGVIWSMLLNIPTFIQVIMLKKRLDNLYANSSDNPDALLSHQGQFTIVTTSREFHPEGDAYPENVKFMGPNNVEQSVSPKDKKLIFVSLGTVEENNAVYPACINAVKDLDKRVVITLAGNKQSKINLKKIPDYVTVYDNMTPTEFRKTISQAALFINSGGVNSVSDSIMGKTPLLICPASAETEEVASVVEGHHCGIRYPYKKITVNGMRKTILQVINDQSTGENLERIRESFLNSMGCKKVVAELIDKFNLA
jgi:MGT family glycosyltransferase